MTRPSRSEMQSHYIGAALTLAAWCAALVLGG